MSNGTYFTRRATKILNQIKAADAPTVTKETAGAALRDMLTAKTGKVLPETWQTNKQKFLRELQDIHKHEKIANEKRRKRAIDRDKSQLEKLFKRDKSYQAYLKSQAIQPPAT